MENPISFLSRAFTANAPPPPVLDLDSFILGYVRYVLELNDGNKKKTAHQLGISRSTLYRILKNGQNHISR
jgi:DNA-binding NtrC family response regulator